MQTSQSLKELATALANFQAEVGPVIKDSTNPYFKSKYATLDNFISTIKAPLAKNGLSYAQFPTGENELCTIVLHKSGEWMQSTAKMYPSKNDPQGQGSAITYMRRYALGAALGIATEEDDDGNNASKRETMKPYTVARKQPASDDEAGGSTTHQEFVQDELNESRKEQIKDILKRTLGKQATKSVVKEITGLDMTPENYEAIIKKLQAAADNTDPLAKELNH